MNSAGPTLYRLAVDRAGASLADVGPAAVLGAVDAELAAPHPEQRHAVGRIHVDRCVVDREVLIGQECLLR